MRRQKDKTRDQDGIYERPDSPYWWATWVDGRGQVARRSTGIRKTNDPRKIEAKRVRAGLIAGNGVDVVDVLAPEPANVRTFGDLIKAYQEDQGSKKAISTQRVERGIFKILFPVFVGRPLDRIDGEAVRTYIKLRRETGVADGTIAREVAAMSAITNWAIEDMEWDIPNAWEKRIPKPALPRDRWLTKEEAVRLLEAAERLAREDGRPKHLPDFIRLSLYTGMRSGEVLGLEWHRVDLEQGVIRFGAGDQKNRKAGSIPINQQARVAILSRQRARVLGSPWVFAHEDGRRLLSVKNSFATACRMAGLSDVRPHDLRRTFGSWLAQAGEPIQRISRLMRHSGIEVTHRIYAHLAPSDLAESAGVLDLDGPRLRAVK